MRRAVPLWGVLTLGLVGWVPGLARAEEGVRLQERFPVGYQYRVSTRVDLTGTLQVPGDKDKPAPKPLAVRGDSAIEYDERVLTLTPEGRVGKTARYFRRMDFRRTVGGRHQETALRPAVRRLILLRHKNTEVPFSPDGPLTWGEIDLVRTDVFTPALAGLLPDRAVRPGERWAASTAAIQELTDMEHLEGTLECRLEPFTTPGGRRQARVAFSGTVRGTNEDGPNRQKLQGYFYFDLRSNHLSYLYLKGVSALLDRDGKEVGHIEGRFVLTRQLGQSESLSDQSLRGVSVEPNAENTLLLYDNPDLGLRFLHPRRRRVAGVRGSQVALDGAEGSGLMLTADTPARTPTGAQFLAESRGYLGKQKARLLRAEAPRRLRESPPLEQFALEVEMGKEKVLMDYYVTRQALGGVTLAARLLPRDLAATRKEVERIARSVVVTRKLEERK